MLANGKWEIRKGNVVSIEAKGMLVTGVVNYAFYDDVEDAWLIEMFECDIPGGYSYWKQQFDGGKIVAVKQA